MTTGIRVVSEETINREYLFIGTAIVTSADKRERYKKHVQAIEMRYDVEDIIVGARLFIIMFPIVLCGAFPAYVFRPMPSCLFWISFLIYHAVLIWLLWESYSTYHLNRNEYLFPNDPLASSVTNKRMVLSSILGISSFVIWGTVHYLAKIEKANNSEKLHNWIVVTILFLGGVNTCSQFLCVTSCMPFGFEPLPVYDKNCPPKYTLTPSN